MSYFDRDAQPEVHPDEWDESHNNFAEPEEEPYVPHAPNGDPLEEDDDQ